MSAFCFHCRLLSLTTTWSQPFAKYFVDTIHPSIDHLGAWILREYGMDSATTNQSETFNYVLKRLQEWKEAPIDALALSLFRLSQYHVTEIRLCGQGEYNLCDGLEMQTSDVLPSIALHLVDIVDGIRRGAAAQHIVGVDSNTTDIPSTPAVLMPTLSTSSSDPSPADIEPDDAVATQDCETGTLTSGERAGVIINSNQISLDPRLAIFTVNGTSEPRVVRLFPTTTCSCPAKSNCYHIMAARMAVGITSDTKKRTVNLTQLRKNTRKRPDKTSGRKRPRLDDVVPAGDQDAQQAADIRAAVFPDHTPGTVAETSSQGTSTGTRTSVNQDICYACEATQPPAGKCRRRRVIDWVGCDKCERWYHACCIHVTAIPDNYVCSMCD